jgi:hypothetical protein
MGQEKIINLVQAPLLKGASKNSEFAQMQGVEKIFAAPHMIDM